MRVAVAQIGGLGRALVRLQKVIREKLSPREAAMPKPEKPRREKPAPRFVNLRLPGERGIRGPAFLPPREFHHVSRQTCRAALRGIAFAGVSKTHPHFSRRTRRAASRTMAKLEYLRMMKDSTNVVSELEERAARAS